MVRHLWFVCLLGLVACTSRPKTPQQPTRLVGQKITIDDQTIRLGGSDTVRFGHLFEGETAVLPLVVENHSSRPIVIVRVERSCGCTTFDFENQPIKSGEARGAKLSFDASGTRGWQLKMVTLHLAEGAAPHKLFVEAEVE